MKQKLVHLKTLYNGTNLPVGNNPMPRFGYQITVIARNIMNGSIYALWYNGYINAFVIGYVINGTQPSNGDSVIVQYIGE